MSVFDELQALAKDRGAEVRVRARFPGDPQAGHFRVQGRRRTPVVSVLVASGNTNQIDDVEDAIVLAHEMGHHQRWRNGEEAPAYRQIVDTPQETWPTLAAETRAAIVTEEAGAWVHARTDLAALGFTAWEIFEARRVDALGSYARHLGLPTLE